MLPRRTPRDHLGSITPIAALPPPLRADLDALAAQLQVDGQPPPAIADAVCRAAADAGYLLSGVALLIRQAVPSLVNWSPLAEWRRSLTTLPAELATWTAAQPPERPPGPTVEQARRRQVRHRQRRWQTRVERVVANMLTAELPEAVREIVAQIVEEEDAA